jgi:hypothetical protein
MGFLPCLRLSTIVDKLCVTQWENKGNGSVFKLILEHLFLAIFCLSDRLEVRDGRPESLGLGFGPVEKRMS